MGMKKIYKSRTSIAVNVVLSSGKSLHVAFTPLSDGSSVYVTDNEDVQRALERHYRYGGLFRVVEVVEDESGKAASPPVADEEADEDGLHRIVVSDLSAAKDYLADTFGISRTALRSERAILAAAAEHGIAFEGL